MGDSSARYARPRPRLTLEQHREVASLGIAWRPVDETWGFKLKCSRRACQNTVKTCYCEVDLAEAIRRVKEERSGYTCSDECWILNGDAEACADGSEEEFTHFVSPARMKRYSISFRKGGWLSKAYNTPQLKRSVQDFLSELKSNLDYDDEGECSCEI